MKIFIKLIIVLIVTNIFLLTSCITERRCERLYPTPIVNTTNTIYKDTTIFIEIHDTLFIKGDTVSTYDTLYLDPITGKYNSNRIYASVDYAKAWAQVIDGEILLELIQNDTAIARLLKDNIVIQEKIVEKVTTIIKKVWVVKWYHTVSIFIAIVSSLFILAYLIVKFTVLKAKLLTFKKK